MIVERIRSIGAALEALARELDAETCSGQEALDLVEALGAARRVVDGMVARVAKRVEDTAAYTYRGGRNAAEAVERLVGISTAEAKRVIEVAAHLRSLPGTSAALRAGRLPSRQAELIVAAAADDPSLEADLLRAAEPGTTRLRDTVVAARAAREDQVARAARQHAARSLRTWTAADGMVEGHFKVTPEVGGAIRARIDQLTRKRFRDARRSGARESQDAYAADAFEEAVVGDPSEAKGGGYTTHVVIDHEALVRGNAIGGERCEIPGVGPVSVEWVRSLLGSSFVTAIVAKGKDINTVAHFGRHVPAELQTAMIASGRECSVAGCHGREYLELDHCEVDHAKGGPTARWNLAWRCSVHHRRKTAGWILGQPHPDTGKRRLEPPPGQRRSGLTSLGLHRSAPSAGLRGCRLRAAGRSSRNAVPPFMECSHPGSSMGDVG